MKNKKDLTKLAFTALILAAAAAPVAGQADQSQDTYLAALGCAAHGCKTVADNANPSDPYNTRNNTYQTGKPYGNQPTSGYRTSGSTGAYGSDTTGSYSNSRPGTSNSYGSDTTGSYTTGSYSSSRPGAPSPYGSDTSSSSDYYGSDRAGTYDSSTGTYKAMPSSTGSYSSNPGATGSYSGSTRPSAEQRMNKGYSTTGGYAGTSDTSTMPSDSYPAGARGSYNPSNPGSPNNPSNSGAWNR